MESASPRAGATSLPLGSKWRRKSKARRILIVMPALFLSMFPGALVFPTIPDIVAHALCDNNPRCSLALYVTGVSSLCSGVLAIFMCVYVGALSDRYGRKPALAAVILLHALPHAVLVAGTSPPLVWAYLLLHMVMSPFSAVTMSLMFAYVADVNGSHGGRGGDYAFSITLIPYGLGNIAGPAVARLLPTDSIFWVSAALSLLAVLWVLVVVPESLHSKQEPPTGTKMDVMSCSPASGDEPPSPVEGEGVPLMPADASHGTKQESCGGDAYLPLPRHQSSIHAGITLVRRSLYLRLLVMITFIVTVAEAGVVASILYYLKARFGFTKSDFSIVYLVSGSCVLVVQLVGMPLFTYLMTTHRVLTFSLALNAFHCFLYGIARSPLVAYVGIALGSFAALFFPVVGALTSRGGSRDEQGLLQGVMTGSRCLANGLGPLLSNTLTGYFISNKAPFDCPGIAFYVAMVFMAVAGVLSLWVPRSPHPLVAVTT